ncbi:hypothetical protein G7085_07565 [Tessaracoccus sp. HDW20]|nr:hypothetical protein [Tessaracoccus coleopterorum]
MGRNPVFEAMTAGLPAKQAYIAEGAERDDRLRDILKYAAEHSIPLLQVTRAELDRVTGGLVHQGVAMQLPAFDYADPEDVLADALEADGIVVALDGVTDPATWARSSDPRAPSGPPASSSRRGAPPP